jgi:acylphosphatase
VTQPERRHAADADETPEPQPHARLTATVRGRVQGVGFRWFVERSSHRLGLTGWVRNRADRSVELVAEGPPSALDRLEVALRDGPPGARVDDVDTRRDPATGEFARFTIRSGSHPGD